MAKYQLTSPEGHKYEIEAPDDAPQDQVLEYFAKQTGRKPEVGTLEAVRRGATDAATFGFWQPYAAHVNTIRDQAGWRNDPQGADYWTNYQRNLAEEDARQAEAAKNVPASVIGKTAGMVAQGVAMLPRQAAVGSYELAKEMARPAQTAMQALIESTPAAARYGASYGAIDAYGHSRGDVGQQIKDIAVGTGEGAIMGPIVNAGLFGVGQGLNAGLNRREARVDANAARMQELREAGVQAPMPLAVTENALARGAGRFSAGQIGGKPIADQATANIGDVQNALARTIGHGLNGREAGDLGQDIQSTLRRQLLDYSIPHEQVGRMTPEDVQAVTGAAPSERRMPRPEPVRPVQPQYPPKMTPDDYIAQQVAKVPAVEPQYPRSRMPAEPPEMVGPTAPAPEALQHVRAIHSEMAQIQGALQNTIGPNRDAAMKRVMGDPFFSTQRFKEMEPLFDQWSRPGPKPLGPKELALLHGPDGPAIRTQLEAYRAYMQAEQQYRGAIERLRELHGQVEPANAQARASAQQMQQEQTQRARSTAAQDAQRLSQQDRIEAERQAYAATEAARQAEAERVRPNADDNAYWANRRAEIEAERAAAAETARLQAEAEQAAAARAEALRSQDRPFESGSSPHSYKSEFEVGYNQAFRDAPPVQFNPLGSKNAPDTATGRLLQAIGEEARQGSKLSGFSGHAFDDTGAIKPDLMRLISNMAGRDVAQRLAVLSEKRATGQFPPSIEGMHDLRSAVGKALSAAKAESRRNGTPLAVDDAFMSRLYGALSDDMQTALRLSGPEGTRAAQRIRQLDDAYRTHLNDNVRPLKSIFGDNVGPVQAMDRLVKAATSGDTRTLAAYMRVMRQKDDPTRGANAILWHMTNGGRDLPAFIREYRDLPTPSRNVLFAGPRGQALEAQLDRYVAAAARLERFIGVSGQRSVVDPTRLTHVMTLAGAIMHWPTVLGAVAGNAVAARMMTSPRYLRGLTEMPAASRGGFDTVMFRNHLARLGAIAGGDKDLGDSFFAAVQRMIGVTPAKAETLDQARKRAGRMVADEIARRDPPGPTPMQVVEAAADFLAPQRKIGYRTLVNAAGWIAPISEPGKREKRPAHAD